jgi:hypothetical protein
MRSTKFFIRCFRLAAFVYPRLGVRAYGGCYSFGYSKGWNTQRNSKSRFFPLPPPLPRPARFPTSPTQQVVYGRLGIDAEEVVKEKNKEEKTEQKNQKLGDEGY